MTSQEHDANLLGANDWLRDHPDNSTVCLKYFVEKSKVLTLATHRCL
jgi:hypothetical protein